MAVSGAKESSTQFFVYHILPVGADAANVLRDISVQRDGEHHLGCRQFSLTHALIPLHNPRDHLAGGSRLFEQLRIQFKCIRIGGDSSVDGDLLPMLL